MRVSLFTPWRERCGIRDYSRHLVEALRHLPEIAEVRIVEAPEAAVRAGSGDAVRHFIGDDRRFRALGAQMNAQNADIAHVQHQYFFFGGVAPHKNHARAFLDAIRIPLVMTVHEIAMPEDGLKGRAISLVNRANFQHPAIRRIIVHTEVDRGRLIALGVDPGRIHVIPVGVPPAEPMPDQQEARRALGLEGKRVVALFGFLAAKKGHRRAIEALRGLPEEVVLLFAGDRHPDDNTDYVPQLQAEIEARGLAERVRITGFLPEAQIPVVMAATDVAIAPFLQSSGSASLAHLLAYARPIVASDIAPHREIASESPSCLLLFREAGLDSERPSDDRSPPAVEGLGAAIDHLLEEPAHRATLEEAARQYAAHHSYANMAQETLAVYRLACEEK